jgi:glycosyltransferase involved in cell wall biosynthesis
MKPLRVCLDACLIDGNAGGVQQVIIGLASGLAKLEAGDEEYLFLAYSDHNQWLNPYMQGPCRILPGPQAPRTTRWKQAIKSILPPIIRTIWERSGTLTVRRSKVLPSSQGFVENANVDVMHFTTQSAFITTVPSIYQPYDLQHLHLPEYFTRRQYAIREIQYRTFCNQAQLIVVMTQWSKQDILENYGLPEGKIAVIPGGAVLTAYPTPDQDEIISNKRKFNLPDGFIFYPAQTWPHKNHIGLLQALAILRDQYELRVPFVSSGRLNEFFPTIRKYVQKLDLTEQVHFLGFVNPVELQCLYKLCRCLVYPSKFEGWGLPITEAMMAGVPIACSNATCLPEQIGDAGLLFDPDDYADIAQAIYKLWTDDTLRFTLVERGRQRVSRYDWDRTARLFRAHYRRIAKRPLTDEDNYLLTEQPAGQSRVRHHG